MAILSDSELDAIKADVLTMLPDTGYILTRTLAPDGFGGNNTTWGTASTTACRLDWKSGNEGLSGGGKQSYTGWMVTIPISVTITTRDNIKINGDVYNVKSIDPEKSWQVSTRCKVDKV